MDIRGKHCYQHEHAIDGHLGVDKFNPLCYIINIITKQKEGKMGINRDKMIELVEDGMVDAKDLSLIHI